MSQVATFSLRLHIAIYFCACILDIFPFSFYKDSYWSRTSLFIVTITKYPRINNIEGKETHLAHTFRSPRAQYQPLLGSGEGLMIDGIMMMEAGESTKQ